MKFSIWLLAVVLGVTAYGTPYNVQRRDMKLASQALLESQTITAPIAASAGTDRIKAAYAGNTAAALVTLTSFAAQPDVPRNIVIDPGGSTGAIDDNCVITVTGTDYWNNSISETFNFDDDHTAAVTGSKAFKTVTAIAFPDNCEGDAFGATWDVGVGDKLGLKRCMASAGDFAWVSVGGAYEGTRPTVAASASVVSSNTIDTSTAYDGSKDVKAYFVQNFACGN